MKKQISVTIDKDKYELFKFKCNKYGYKISSRLEALVTEDLKSG